MGQAQLLGGQFQMFIEQLLLRSLGMGLGALPVAVVLYQRDAGLAAWAWTVFCGLLWPHVAYQLARRS